MSLEEETLKLMLETHVPSSYMLNEEYAVQRSSPHQQVQGNRDCALAGQIVSYEKNKSEFITLLPVSPK
jgi:hypothetical protein